MQRSETSNIILIDAYFFGHKTPFFLKSELKRTTASQFSIVVESKLKISTH